MSNVSSKLAHDILRYAQQNPDAADTAEGVAKWWLHDKYPLTTVRQVLAELTAAGLMEEREGISLQKIYRKKGAM